MDSNSHINRRKECTEIISQAIELLTQGQGKKVYTQKEVVKKMRILGYVISESTLSNLKNTKNSEKRVNLKTLIKAANGLEELIRHELQYSYNRDKKSFEFRPELRNIEIKVNEVELPTNSIKSIPYTLHYEGRRSVNEKVALYKDAQKQIIELGVRLKSFSTHFIDESDNAFKLPLVNKLREGVNLHCYVLNPRGRFATGYFQDRAKAQPEEMKNLEELPEILGRLKEIKEQLNAKSDKGKMSLFYLNTFPYIHASVIDGEEPTGKMFVSPYLFGVRRANSPVLEISKSRDRFLFNRFWFSVKKMIEHSVKIT